MKYLKSSRAIGTLFAFSSILLAVACFTITNTFAFPKRGTFEQKKWSVSLLEVTEASGAQVYSFNDKMDFNVTLNKSGDNYIVKGIIANDGSFDAILSTIDITNLENIKIGTSEETGITYYLSDFILIKLGYAKDNRVNEIYEGEKVSVGDLLAKHTKNEFVLTLQYKDSTSLTEDALKVLKQNVAGDYQNRPLKFSMSVGFYYVENKR